MSFYRPPIQNVSVFDSELFNSEEQVGLTRDQADFRYLRFPNAQGTENLQSIVVNGTSQFNNDVSFNNIPVCTAVQPAANDSSTKMPTTSWVQSAISSGTSGFNNIYTYPQKWQSSLIRLNNNFTATVTYPAQTLTIRFPIPETGNNPASAFVRLLLSITMYGTFRDAGGGVFNVGNIFTCQTELGIFWNLRTGTNSFVTSVFSNTVNNALSTTTGLNNIIQQSTIPIATQQALFPPSQDRNSTFVFTPVTIQASGTSRNQINIVWNRPFAAYGATFQQQYQEATYGITRSAEIISSSLNTILNTGNLDVWNTMTYPNANSVLGAGFAGTTQNLPAYFSAVSTNGY